MIISLMRCKLCYLRIFESHQAICISFLQYFIQIYFEWKLGFIMMSFFSTKLTKHLGLFGEVGVYSRLVVDVFGVHYHGSELSKCPETSGN